MTPTRYRRHIIGMSGRIFVAPHHSTEDLERRYKAADDGVERGHLHIIWLLHLASEPFGEVRGGGHGLYTNQQDPVALQRPRSGRAGRRPAGQSRCRPAARRGPAGGVARQRATARRRAGRKVACWISGRIGRKVSPQRGVEYLRRLDLTRQLPRPANPKARLYEKGRFKKTQGGRVRAGAG